MGAFAYTIIKSKKRRRTVSLSISSEGVLRVMAPFGSRLEVIESIIHKRSAWIKHKIALFKQQRKTAYVQNFTNGAKISYLGQTLSLRITQNESLRGGCFHKENEIEVVIPDTKLSAKTLCEEARIELILWYKKQARRDFQERLVFWSEKLGVSCGRLVITNPSRRWGSCNSKNDIRLNWRLIMANPKLLDYVIAHELSHITHKNHSRAFWNFLGSAIPDYKSRRMQLRGWERSGKFGF